MKTISKHQLGRGVRPNVWAVYLIALCVAWPAFSVERTWYHMTTGNGHGFQIFDRKANKITQFLEHPYRYVAPVDSQRNAGI